MLRYLGLLRIIRGIIKGQKNYSTVSTVNYCISLGKYSKFELYHLWTKLFSLSWTHFAPVEWIQRIIVQIHSAFSFHPSGCSRALQYTLDSVDLLVYWIFLGNFSQARLEWLVNLRKSINWNSFGIVLLKFCFFSSRFHSFNASRSSEKVPLDSPDEEIFAKPGPDFRNARGWLIDLINK